MNEKTYTLSDLSAMSGTTLALIDENHVTRRMYKEVLLIVSIGDE